MGNTVHVLMLLLLRRIEGGGEALADTDRGERTWRSDGE
jgi:hypothetical protein